MTIGPVPTPSSSQNALRPRKATDADQRKVQRRPLNVQIGHELGNSNQYVAIAAFFEGECLFGLAKIYFKQAEEDRDHAMKFVQFVLDAGGKVAIPEVPAPRNEFRSAEDAAQLALDSELRTTRQIYDLVELATAEKNHIAKNFLQWFVNEQLEEVSSAETRLSVIKRAGPNVLMVEAYLAMAADNEEGGQRWPIATDARGFLKSCLTLETQPCRRTHPKPTTFDSSWMQPGIWHNILIGSPKAAGACPGSNSSGIQAALVSLKAIVEEETQKHKAEKPSQPAPASKRKASAGKSAQSRSTPKRKASRK